jgi:hypothetical protein
VHGPVLVLHFAEGRADHVEQLAGFFHDGLHEPRHGLVAGPAEDGADKAVMVGFLVQLVGGLLVGLLDADVGDGLGAGRGVGAAGGGVLGEAERDGWRGLEFGGGAERGGERIAEVGHVSAAVKEQRIAK